LVQHAILLHIYLKRSLKQVIYKYYFLLFLIIKIDR